jgi:hypothetical protein
LQYTSLQINKIGKNTMKVQRNIQPEIRPVELKSIPEAELFI